VVVLAGVQALVSGEARRGKATAGVRRVTFRGCGFGCSEIEFLLLRAELTKGSTPRGKGFFFSATRIFRRWKIIK
jgi:hypothetical protein